MEKYTPLMRERKASQPKMKATIPGSQSTAPDANRKEWNGSQNSGSCL